MGEKLTYLGITFNKDDLKTFEELGFVKEENGDDISFISPQYEHGNDMGVFNNMKYRFVITCECDSGATIKNEQGEEVDADFYIAYIIPDMELIHDSKIKELQELFGWDDHTLEEVRETLTYYDVVREYGVCLGSNLIPTSEWNYDIINGMATAIQIINSVKGFFLDTQYNWLMNGWDMLEFAMTSKTIEDFNRHKI